MSRPLKLHWSGGKPNFGDALSPLICEALSGRRVVHASPRRCELIAIGSVLQRLSEGWLSRRVQVWGSGLIEDRPARRSRHYYCAVRGPLTRARILNAPVDLPLGDPGLLCELLLPARPPARRYRAGLIPHYKEQRDPRIAEALRQRGVRLIDVYAPPAQFIAEVAACRFVLSSSLHELITADALGVPNAWMSLSAEVRGGGFKFRDYYANFGIEDPRPVGLPEGLAEAFLEQAAAEYSRPGLDALKQGLLRSFPFLRREA